MKRNSIVKKFKFEKKKYLLIENYWDIHPCFKCAFVDRCDQGEFHGSEKMKVNPAEHCGDDSYFIYANDINKEDA